VGINAVLLHNKKACAAVTITIIKIVQKILQWKRLMFLRLMQKERLTQNFINIYILKLRAIHTVKPKS
jgi:hypothetical protein